MTKKEFEELKVGNLITPTGNSRYRGVQMEVVAKGDRRVQTNCGQGVTHIR
jgi:hypothetical protein